MGLGQPLDELRTKAVDLLSVSAAKGRFCLANNPSIVSPTICCVFLLRRDRSLILLRSGDALAHVRRETYLVALLPRGLLHINAILGVLVSAAANISIRSTA